MNTDLERLRSSSVFAEESFVVDVQSFLHTLMEEKGVSRAELADAMGVSRARVSQIFSSECKNFTVRLLARAFFALGEQAELTCEHHRDQQRRAKRARVTFMPSEAMTAVWSYSDGNAVNDNGAGTVRAKRDIEVASSPNNRRIGQLVSSMGRALERERVA